MDVPPILRVNHLKSCVFLAIFFFSVSHYQLLFIAHIIRLILNNNGLCIRFQSNYPSIQLVEDHKWIWHVKHEKVILDSMRIFREPF